MTVSKGSALHSTLAFLRTGTGEAGVARVLDRLDTADRARVEAVCPTDEISFALLLQLWRAADAVLGPEQPDWMERAGAFSIDSLGSQLYGGILRKSSPREFLTQPISLFRLYYQPGEMQVVEDEPGRAVLRLVGLDPGDRLFCRRQVGGLRRALEIAGGRNAQVSHVRCCIEGDAFCEWNLRWD